MKIFALIPARGGSKGIPRKNVRLIGGKPLIAWSIETAFKVRRLTTVIVSTDDEEVANIALSCGAEVPFIRPPALARDDTPGMAVVDHALANMPGFDAVTVLQPTSPLRTGDDVEGCLDLMESTGAPAVVSVSEASLHPLWMYQIAPTGRMVPVMEGPVPSARQQLPAVYALNGAIYLAKSEWLRGRESFVGPETVAYEMPPERSVDIDTPLDWDLAELLLGRRA